MDLVSINRINYRPIDEKSNDIRLLRLHSRRSGEIPSCEIFHASLDGEVGFKALSYTWGDASLRGVVKVDGQAIAVTRNLSEALGDIRGMQSDKIVWVDALCIDQANIRERSHQVRKMGRIYQEAKCVDVWLGRPSRALNNGADGGYLETLKWIHDMIIRKSEFEDNTSVVSEMLRTPEGQLKWLDLLAICHMPYWNRLWIVQEFCLAAQLEVYHGEDSIDWKIFSRVLDEIIHDEKADIRYGSDQALAMARSVLESMPGRLGQQKFNLISSWLLDLKRDLKDIMDLQDLKYRHIAEHIQELSDIWHSYLIQLNVSPYSKSEKLVIETDTGVDELLDIRNQHYNALPRPSLMARRYLEWHSQSLSLHLGQDNQFESELETRLILEKVTDIERSFKSGFIIPLEILDGFIFMDGHIPEDDDGLHDSRVSRLRYMHAQAENFRQRCNQIFVKFESFPDLLKDYKKRPKLVYHLHSLLESCETSVCQEPRDKVYGLLGLANDVKEEEVDIDYSKPLFELYTDTLSIVLKGAAGRDVADYQFNLPRFSQLFQRSLGGPFLPYTTTRAKLGLQNISAEGSLFPFIGHAVEAILPLESSETSTMSITRLMRQRRESLRDYLRGTMEPIILDATLRRTVTALGTVDVEVIHSTLPQPCSISSNPQAEPQLQPPLLPSTPLPKHHPRLFIGSSGRIGIGPTNLREDDVLCQFPDCDVSAIIRPCGDQYRLVGRAVVARSFDEKEKRVSSSSPELFRFGVPESSDLLDENRVYWHVDAITLQALTCPASEKRDYDFETPDLSHTATTSKP
ncbi:HET domain-containing protein [Phlyctema vagabunda]|uniref:HET domain-containing protein n=1 Tax=Phlyctema vagabunda TaxID=108571 RepID=A0ABR4PT73_9HELO